MKTTFPNSKPKIVQEEEFRIKFREKLHNKVVTTYVQFDEIFLKFLNKHV